MAKMKFFTLLLHFARKMVRLLSMGSTLKASQSKENVGMFSVIALKINDGLNAPILIFLASHSTLQKIMCEYIRTLKHLLRVLLKLLLLHQ